MPRVKKENNQEIKRPRRKMASVRTVKGMRDILSTEWHLWEHILKTSEKLCQSFGFERIEIPILEHTELFKRGVGQITDIVEKEMFSFKTRGGDEVSLRPEGTAGIVRAYLQNGMNKWSQPVKLYYEGPIFRYEKPQAGRYREHHQFGFEVFGDKCPAVDAQVICLAWKLFQKIGLKNVVIQINSIGCEECRSGYKKLLVDYYGAKKSKLCVDCKKRLTENPMRLLDCKEDKCLQASSAAPQTIDHLCKECHSHFKNVLEFLDELELSYVLNPNLVRGLDYYTRTVFEIWPSGEESESRQSSLGGGGRYDNLVRCLGGEDTPAVGFSFGIERVVEKILRDGFIPKTKIEKKVFLVQLGDLARKKVLKLFDRLIDGNISVGESVGRGSIKSQLRMANRFNSEMALIVGQKEAIDDTMIIRDMASGMQEIVPMENAVAEMKKRLKK